VNATIARAVQTISSMVLKFEGVRGGWLRRTLFWPYRETVALSQFLSDGRSLSKWYNIYTRGPYIMVYHRYIFSGHTTWCGANITHVLREKEGAENPVLGRRAAQRMGREGGESEKPLPPTNPPPYRRPDFSSRQCIYTRWTCIMHVYIYIYTRIHCNIYTHCQIHRPHRTAARVPFFAAIHPRGPANRSAPTHFCPVPRKWKATRDSPLKRYSVATETTPPTIATATATVTATAAAATTTTTAACPSVSLYYIAAI